MERSDAHTGHPILQPQKQRDRVPAQQVGQELRTMVGATAMGAVLPDWLPFGCRHHGAQITGRHTHGLPAERVGIRFCCPVCGRSQRGAGAHSAATAKKEGLCRAFRTLSQVLGGDRHGVDGGDRGWIARCALFVNWMPFSGF